MTLSTTGLRYGAFGLLAGLAIAFFTMRPVAAPTPIAKPAATAEISNQELVDRFHRYYYQSSERTWSNMRWLGVPTLKMPLDMWIYQEILYEVKPDVLIECGTYNGGSALYFASMMDLIKKGRVITIDIEPKPNLPKHPRINYLLGSSISPEIVAKVRSLIKPGETVMVSLDSNHSKAHVLAELKTYADLVSVRSYLVVEDTNINGHPVYPEFGPGPMEALNEFLPDHKNFTIDKEREKFFVSFNPSGYLKKVSAK